MKLSKTKITINYLLLIIITLLGGGCTDQVNGPGAEILRLIFPNGGERLMADSTYNINWESANIDKINISYSIDDGTTWNTFGKNINSSIGYFPWTVPDNLTTEALIKISATDNSKIDISDNIFTITKIYSLKVLFPNGGETLIADSTYNINWESANIDKINISYSIDDGTTWNTFGKNVNSSIGYFPWNVPDSITTKGLIKISTSDNSQKDISDNTFSINYSRGGISESLKYYPLDVGDMWIYNFSWYPLYSGGTVKYLLKMEITKQGIFDGKSYSYVKVTPIIHDTTILNSNPFTYYPIPWQRVDSTTGLISYFSSGYNIPWVNIAMSTGDTFESGSGTGYSRIDVLSETDAQVLGVNTTVKKYEKQDAFQKWYYDFAKNIGIIRFKQYGDGDNNFDYTLKGAKIGNIVIGDTTTTN